MQIKRHRMHLCSIERSLTGSLGSGKETYESYWDKHNIVTQPVEYEKYRMVPYRMVLFTSTPKPTSAQLRFLRLMHEPKTASVLPITYTIFPSYGPKYWALSG